MFYHYNDFSLFLPLYTYIHWNFCLLSKGDLVAKTLRGALRFLSTTNHYYYERLFVAGKKSIAEKLEHHQCCQLFQKNESLGGAKSASSPTKEQLRQL